MASISKGLDIVRKVTQYSLNKGRYGKCMKNVEFISADNGNCVAEFTIGEEHLNISGTLHGGCTATLIDCVSSCGLMTAPRAHPGVSVDLHVTFLKASRPGEVITIDSKTVKAGKTLAFLAIEMAQKSDGAIVARGTHTKYIGETLKPSPV